MSKLADLDKLIEVRATRLAHCHIAGRTPVPGAAGRASNRSRDRALELLIAAVEARDRALERYISALFRRVDKSRTLTAAGRKVRRFATSSTRRGGDR